jgi:sulfopyruvate decarboxylase subunit alpha
LHPGPVDARDPDVTKPTETVRALVSAEITHVLGIPDNTSAPLFTEIRRHPTIRLVTVTREGEAIAIAAGLWMGGASPLVVIQNTGLLESGDALRGTALRMGAPIPLIVTGRGYDSMRQAGVTPDDLKTVELLTRPDVDSAALMTEPTLEAWAIPHRRCDPEDDPVEAIELTIAEAYELGRPAAVIIARTLT